MMYVITCRATPSPILDLTQLAIDLTTLRAAVANQTSFIGITAQQTAPIQAALSSCIRDVDSLLETAETFMSSAQGVANVVGGGVDYLLAQQFGIYLNVAVQVPDLLDIESFLERMQANLAVEVATVAPSAIPASGNKFTLGQSVLGGPNVLGA